MGRRHTFLVLCCLVLALAAPPAWTQNADDLLSQAIVALRKGKLDEAERDLKSVLVIDPDNAEAYYRLGLLYVKRRKIDQAIEYFKKSTRLAPSNIRIGLKLAELYETLGRYAEAQTEYKRLLAVGKKDRRLKRVEKRLAISTGRELAKKGELNAALLVFNGLLSEFGDDPEVLFNIASTYVLLNRVQEAKQTFQRLLKYQPKNLLAHFNLANIYEREGNLDKAIEHLETIDRLNAKNRITRVARERLGILRGRRFMAQRRFRAAVEAFRQVVEANPKNQEAWFNLGAAYLQMGDHEQGEAAFKEVLALDPDNFSARLNLANFYLAVGRVNEAIEQLRYVIEHDQRGRYRKVATARLNDVYTTLADQKLRAGQVEEGLKEYEKALAIFPGNVKALFNKGVILAQQKKLDEAAEAFRKVIQLDPKNLRAYLNLAYIHEQKNELTLASQQYEKILEIGGDAPEVDIARQKWRITKAKGLWLDQRLNAARKELEAILADAPDDLEANFYYGLVTSGLGDLREAARAYQRVLQKRPDNHRMRMLLGQVYQQLELEELAAGEYRTVIFGAKDPAIIAEAEQRLAEVERSLSGFSNTLSYVMAFDSNINFNDENPAQELRSDLSFNFMYRHKMSERWRLSLTASPRYSTYHLGQFDYYNSSYRLNVIYGQAGSKWNLGLSRAELSNLLTEVDVSHTETLTIERSVRRYLPALFGLNPRPEADARIPTALVLRLSTAYLSSFGNAGLNSVTPTLTASIAQGLKGGFTLTLGTGVSARRNLVQKQNYRDIIVTDPLTGQEETVKLLTFDSMDYEYNSVLMNASALKTLSPGLSLNVGTQVSYYAYINVDSGSWLNGGNEKRNNLGLTLFGRLSYQFYKDLQFYVAGNAQRNYSSLPVADATQQTVEDSVRNFQSTALGDYTRFTLTAGLQMTF